MRQRVTFSSRFHGSKEPAVYCEMCARELISYEGDLFLQIDFLR